MKALAITAALLVGIGSLALAKAAAEAPGRTQFATRIVITEMRNGKAVVLAEPHLLTIEGQEGASLSGGEVPTNVNPIETLSFGLSARVKVRELPDGKLRVSIYAGQSNLDERAGQLGGASESVVVREQGVHCVRTIAAGEKIELELDAGRKVTATIQPVVAR
jgi:Flp pilus assembly secretin CpaC